MVDVPFGGALWLLHAAGVKISYAGQLSFYSFFEEKNSSCAHRHVPTVRFSVLFSAEL